MDEKRLFGEIAVEKGYITLGKVKRALEVQRDMIKNGEGHKLIGVLLVELGFMTAEQVVDVLDHFDAERAAEEEARLAAGELSDTEKSRLLGDETPDPLLPPRF